MASYSFHHRCGSCAKISNRSRSAERAHPLAEFNKAVVISDRPLQDGKAFQVKIDSKASTWTGSILIGTYIYSQEVQWIGQSSTVSTNSDLGSCH